MTWIWLAIASYLLWAFTNICDKIILSKYLKDPLTYNLLAFLIGTLLTVIFISLYKGISLLPWLILLIVLFAGAIRFFSFWLYCKATSQEEISRVTILWQTSPIFTILIAYFLIHERLVILQIIAFILLVIGGLIAAIKSNSGNSKFIKISPAFWLMLFSAFIIALSYVLLKYAFAISDFWPVIFWATIGEIAIILIISPIFKKNLFQSFQKLPTGGKTALLIGEFASITAFIFNASAVLLGPASLISALSATNSIFVFILALIGSIFIPKLIKEEISAKVVITKIIALLFISGGLILLAIK